MENKITVSNESSLEHFEFLVHWDFWPLLQTQTQARNQIFNAQNSKQTKLNQQ